MTQNWPLWSLGPTQQAEEKKIQYEIYREKSRRGSGRKGDNSTFKVKLDFQRPRKNRRDPKVWAGHSWIWGSAKITKMDTKLAEDPKLQALGEWEEWRDFRTWAKSVGWGHRENWEGSKRDPAFGSKGGPRKTGLRKMTPSLRQSTSEDDRRWWGRPKRHRSQEKNGLYLRNNCCNRLLSYLLVNRWAQVSLCKLFSDL